MMNMISSATALVFKKQIFPKINGCIREQFAPNTAFAWFHVVSSVEITKWTLKTAHSWLKTPRNTQNNNASRSTPWRKDSTRTHLALELPVWLHRICLPLFGNNYQATALLAAPWACHPPLSLISPFLLCLLCILPFCSLFSSLSLTYFLLTFHSLPLAHRGHSILYTSTSKLWLFPRGNAIFMCSLYFFLCSMPTTVLHFLLCSNSVVVVNDTLMAVLSTVHLTPFSISSVAFIA